MKFVDMSEKNSTARARVGCSVPTCSVTSTKNPDKKFFASPKDPKMRHSWLKAIGRKPNDLSLKTNFYVCEDHFNLEFDLKNFMSFTYGNYKRRSLKPDAVPSVFKCQKDKTTKYENIKERSASKGKFRRKLVQKYITADENSELHEEESTARPSNSTEGSSCRIFTADKSIQCNIRNHYRSKQVQCNLSENSSLLECSYFEPHIEIHESLSGSDGLSMCTDRNSTTSTDNIRLLRTESEDMSCMDVQCSSQKFSETNHRTFRGCYRKNYTLEDFINIVQSDERDSAIERGSKSI